MKNVICLAYLLIAISFMQCDNNNPHNDSAGYVGQPVICPVPEDVEVDADAGTYRIELEQQASISTLRLMVVELDDQLNSSIIEQLEYNELLFPFCIEEGWATISYQSSRVIEVTFTKNETNYQRWVVIHFNTPFDLGETARIRQQKQR